MIELSIDTTDRLRAEIRLTVDKKIFKEIVKSSKPQSDIILPLIEKLCSKARIKPNEITHVYVKTGPGSYTGVRIGVSIANAFGLASHAIINNMPKGSLAEPIYS